MLADQLPTHWMPREGIFSTEPHRTSHLRLFHWLVLSLFVPKCEVLPEVRLLKDLCTFMASILLTSSKFTSLGLTYTQLPFLLLPEVPRGQCGFSETDPTMWFLTSASTQLFHSLQAMEWITVDFSLPSSTVSPRPWRVISPYPRPAQSLHPTGPHGLNPRCQQWPHQSSCLLIIQS